MSREVKYQEKKDKVREPKEGEKLNGLYVPILTSEPEALLDALVMWTRKTLRADSHSIHHRGVTSKRGLFFVTDESPPRNATLDFSIETACFQGEPIQKVQVQILLDALPIEEDGKGSCEKHLEIRTLDLCLNNYAELPAAATRLMQNIYSSIYDTDKHLRVSNSACCEFLQLIPPGQRKKEWVLEQQKNLMSSLESSLFTSEESKIQVVPPKDMDKNQNSVCWRLNAHLTLHLPPFYPCETGEVALDTGDRWIPLILCRQLLKIDVATALALGIQRVLLCYKGMQQLAAVIQDNLLSQLDFSCDSHLWTKECATHKLKLLDLVLKQTGGTGIDPKTICVGENTRLAKAAFGWSSDRVPIRLSFCENEWIQVRKPMWRYGKWTWSQGTARTWWMRWYPFKPTSESKKKNIALHLVQFVSRLYALLTLYPVTYEWQSGDCVDALDGNGQWRAATIKEEKEKEQQKETSDQESSDLRQRFSVHYSETTACSDETLCYDRLSPSGSRSLLPAKHVSAGDLLLMKKTDRVGVLVAGQDATLVLTRDPEPQLKASQYTLCIARSDPCLSVHYQVLRAPIAGRASRWLESVKTHLAAAAGELQWGEWKCVAKRTLAFSLISFTRCVHGTERRFQIKLPHDITRCLVVVNLLPNGGSERPNKLILTPSVSECKGSVGAEAFVTRIVEGLDALVDAEVTDLLASLQLC